MSASEPATITAPPAASPLPELAQRRGVDAQRVGAERAVGEARPGGRAAPRVAAAPASSTRPPSPLERATIRPDLSTTCT